MSSIDRGILGSSRFWFALVLVIAVNVTIAILVPAEASAAKLEFGRKNHSATRLPDGRVLVVGGETPAGPVGPSELLGPEGSTRSTVSALVEPRGAHSATLLEDGRVLIIGGRGASGTLASTEIYDPAADNLSPGPYLNRPRAGHTATTLADGRVLVAGGDAAGSAEVYDPAAGSFVLLQALLNVPRSMHGASLLTDGAVLLAGGLDSDGEPMDTAEVFVPDTESFEPVPGWMHAERVRPVMRLLPDGKLQIWGGDQGDTIEIFEPTGRYFRANIDPAIAEPLLSFTDSRGTQVNLELPAATPPDGSASVDIPALNLRAVIGGGDAGWDVIHWFPASPARLMMDHVAYGPNRDPMILGTDWQPGEVVTVFRQPAYPPDAEPIVLSLSANEVGAFYSTEITSEHYSPGMTYLMTAVGLASHRVAQTVYYDAPQIRNDDPTRRGPMRVHFSMPLSGSPGTADTEIGRMAWTEWRRIDTGEPVSRSIIDDAFNFANAGLPLDICFGGVCATLEEIAGHFDVDGSLNGVLDIDWGCVPCFWNPECYTCGPCPWCCSQWWCWVPKCSWCPQPCPECCSCDFLPEVREAGVRLSLEADAGIEVLLALSAEIHASAAIPGLGFAADFCIPANPDGTCPNDPDISGTISLGLVFHVDGGVANLRLRPYLEVHPKVTVGAGYTSSDGFNVNFCPEPASETCFFEADAGVELVSLGEAELKTSLRLEAGVGIDLFDFVDLGADAGIGPYLKGNIGLDPFIQECDTWHADIDAGVDTSAGANATLNLWFFELNWEGEVEATLWDFDIADFWGTGDLDVQTTTIGTDLDPDGYEVRIARAEPDVAPAWADETRPIGLNDTQSFAGELCRYDFINGIQNCFLVATDHDVSLEDVMWNCTATAPIDASVCLPFDQRVEVLFDVRCESVFRVLSDMVDEFAASGAIGSERLRRKLQRLLDSAEQARDGLAPQLPGPQVRTCEDWLSAFIAQVKDHAGGLINVAAAQTLIDRAGDMVDNYCGE
jgi:hypothetical protein